ncbi:MAG: alpha-2-macroglobulin family protein, partial [Bacteroidia bacterium]|nr:alpha-2-macroglobulin family protein [Bacteroidia bacterium]
MLCSIFFSCNFNRNGIRVTGTNFGEEVQQLQNLVFHFNSNIADDTALDKWDKTKYIEFNPPIAGNYKWTAKNELLFSPSADLKPCTKYTAKITDKVLRNKEAKKKRLASQKVIEFHTPFLKLETSEAYWVRNPETGSPQIKVKSNFNYNVKAEKIIPLMVASVNGEQQGFKMSESKLSKSVSAIISGRKTFTSKASIDISIKKGLNAEGTNCNTTKDFVKNLQLSDPSQLDIVSVTNEFDDNSGVITVLTSQQLETQDLNACFTLSPELSDKTVTANENGFKITGAFQQNVTYNITINTGLTGAVGGKMKESYTADLFFGKMPSSISFVSKNGAFITNKGLKNVGLNIINVDKVHLKISKIYENNIIAYMGSNRYSDYDYYESEDGEYSDYQSNYTYNEDYNGRYSTVLVDRMVNTKDLPTNNGVSLLNIDLNDDKKFKGVYHVMVYSDDDYYLKATKLISISDIGLIAKQSGNDILVLANSLLTAEPAGNVEISLISTNNQNVYKLRTGSDGIVKFKDLKENAPGFDIAMVTAKQGDDFKYLLF